MTDYFVPLFKNITTTEVSQSMVNSLGAKGFEYDSLLSLPLRSYDHESP